MILILHVCLPTLFFTNSAWIIQLFWMFCLSDDTIPAFTAVTFCIFSHTNVCRFITVCDCSLQL